MPRWPWTFVCEGALDFSVSKLEVGHGFGTLNGNSQNIIFYG